MGYNILFFPDSITNVLKYESGNWIDRTAATYECQSRSPTKPGIFDKTQTHRHDLGFPQTCWPHVFSSMLPHVPPTACCACVAFAMIQASADVRSNRETK